MAANANREYRTFRYYEGTCSSSDFVKELAKVLALGVKTKPIIDADGEMVEPAAVLKARNWDIAYPTPDSSLGLGLTDDLTDEEYWNVVENLTVDQYIKKINNQISKATDTIILRTTTTPKKEGEVEVDDLTVDESTNDMKLSMYLELYKPEYIADPEQYPLDCERQGVIPRLITKEMYQDALKRNKSEIDNIFDDPNTCTMEKKIIEIDSADLYLTKAQVDAYVEHINVIYNADDIIPVPVDSSESAVAELVIQKEYLNKIKNQDSVLYNLFLDMLKITEDEYVLLKNVTVHISRMDVVNSTSIQYTFALLADKVCEVYTVKAGTTYMLKEGHVATEKLRPEFYLNGTYISVPREYYKEGTTNSVISFNKDFSFCNEKYGDAFRGLLCVRYKYPKDVTDIVHEVSDIDISERATIKNNHYILMRMFDNISEDKRAPMANILDAEGNVIKTNSHTSPWTKLSWYRDFEEILIDELDEDDSISQIAEGTVFVPLETVGLNEDTKLMYWINTNNDRFDLVVMGNPSMDYEMERHLISFSYSGRIESFENSINDVSGNFALFGSSSTDPCYTTISSDIEEHPLERYETKELLNGSSKLNEYLAHIQDIGGVIECNGGVKFYVNLPANTYFYEYEQWPKYLIVDSSNTVIVDYENVDTCAFNKKRNFDKSNELEITVEKAATYGPGFKIYLNFGYYRHKYVITSGVTRDVFGNVVSVKKEQSYGLNTSDGTTSIMMFHTRSKAYYQKHQMLFATTEEYMSKVMYGKSAYTGEYYADRIKVTHGNDGPRGILSDMLVIDNNSLYPQDELVVNKDFLKDEDELEETFIYFPITAFYSPLSDSPNARYGIAIKKSEREPVYADEQKMLDIAIAELNTRMDNIKIIDRDFGLIDKTENGCSVHWDVINGSSWYITEENKIGFVPVQISIANTKEYKGDLDADGNLIEEAIIPKDFEILPGTTVGTDVEFKVKIKKFEPIITEGDTVLYGISNEPASDILLNAEIRAVVDDKTTSSDHIHSYNIATKPADFVNIAVTGSGKISSETEITIENAMPDKYLTLYSCKKVPGETLPDGTVTPDTYKIKGYGSVSLAGTPEPYSILKYPCNISVSVSEGGGKNSSIVDIEDGNNEVSYLSKVVDYDSDFYVAANPNPATTWKLSKIVITSPNVLQPDGTPTRTEIPESDIDANIDGSGYPGYKIEHIHDDLRVELVFKRV